MGRRYRGRHRKEPYGATIGQKTVKQLLTPHVCDGHCILWCAENCDHDKEAA